MRRSDKKKKLEKLGLHNPVKEKDYGRCLEHPNEMREKLIEMSKQGMLSEEEKGYNKYMERKLAKEERNG